MGEVKPVVSGVWCGLWGVIPHLQFWCQLSRGKHFSPQPLPVFRGKRTRPVVSDCVKHLGATTLACPPEAGSSAFDGCLSSRSFRICWTSPSWRLLSSGFCFFNHLQQSISVSRSLYIFPLNLPKRIFLSRKGHDLFSSLVVRSNIFSCTWVITSG